MATNGADVYDSATGSSQEWQESLDHSQVTYDIDLELLSHLVTRNVFERPRHAHPRAVDQAAQLAVAYTLLYERHSGLNLLIAGNVEDQRRYILTIKGADMASVPNACEDLPTFRSQMKHTRPADAARSASY